MAHRAFNQKDCFGSFFPAGGITDHTFFLRPRNDISDTLKNNAVDLGEILYHSPILAKASDQYRHKCTALSHLTSLFMTGLQMELLCRSKKPQWISVVFVLLPTIVVA